MGGFATPNSIMMSPWVSHTFSRRIRVIMSVKRLGLWVFCSYLAWSVSPFESTFSYSLCIHFELFSSGLCALPFSCYNSSQLGSNIVALTRHDRVSLYICGPYTTEHVQAWIQDRCLLKNSWWTPCVYLRQAFSQIGLLFKDLRYLIEWPIQMHLMHVRLLTILMHITVLL